MSVALIGGSGFIGTNLAKLFTEKNIEFTIMDKVKSDVYPDRWKYCDVTEYNGLLSSLRGHDTIINLAAEHKDNVRPISLYYQVNVDGAKNICNAADELNIKNIVFTSSVAVYGFVEKDTDESGEYAPFNHYGKSKLEAEKIYDAWFTSSPDKKLVTIRPTVVFGVGNRGNVYNLFRQIATGKFLMIGSGENEKSMAYVENVATFLKLTLSFPVGYHLINYVDKPDFTMNELSTVIYTCLDKNSKVIRVPYVVGVCAGYIFDFLAKVSGKELPISSIRIKKFCAKTQFSSMNVGAYNFIAPFSLQDAVVKTISEEFINK
ncbi:NAD-dependent epimerase/dehydratase family protein [Yersinia enterocolitica]|uniref:NAD-dependent epimerase/dehydratase family protein n=1 Tax=Yersinia enterocolitica TaxID=630 RepID=UPI0021E77D8D|nr:NAD-dependent epimerase/dehydratase family protein [Yersinia enterocolitica]EKN3948949.1 NAD-dependent epimerase/dehydratase family protein [Yersinia enterocolitica]EKN3982406.1 NAD-dependent epimerase/dehydratase family protein [Yersinia enterocolitica]EKN3986048.1 NAD-dependent epimerase/dehydratase family protein [Yersinia enterocolitica]EKN6224369.1 NAD-dependent epimerase/dehydratase family protein [Yersinia enterocolitica]EKN6318784.1 NAD-dependent epimerase/dehydratase family protein